MRVAKKGENNPMFGKIHNEETISKNTASQPNSIKIEVLDLGASPTNTKTTYNSIREAARALNIPRESISCFVKNNQKKPYKGRYIFNVL
jgi:group I intron endonuclease